MNQILDIRILLKLNMILMKESHVEVHLIYYHILLPALIADYNIFKKSSLQDWWTR